jgi:hypothetical protein
MALDDEDLRSLWDWIARISITEKRSFSNLEQVLPLVKVAAEPQFLRDLEARNYAAFDTLTGLPGRLGCSPIFSAGLIEVRGEAVPLGQ